MYLQIAYAKAGTYLLFAMLFLAAAVAFAEPQMQVNYIGGFDIPYWDYDTVYVMQGDSLAFYNYSIENRSINIQRGMLAPNGMVSPQQTVFSFEVPADWGQIWDYPLFFEGKNGKLYAAFDIDAMLLVFFTDADGTQMHSFDRSAIQYIDAVQIIDENSGFVAAVQYPNFNSWVCRMDFNQHSLPVFHLPPPEEEVSQFQFLSFGDEYLLAWKLNSEGTDLVIQNNSIIQTLPAGWADYNSGYGYTQKLCGTYYYTLEFGMLDGDSRSVIAWLENNQLGRSVFSQSTMHSSPNQLSYCIPQSDSTFICVYSDGQFYTSTFRNYRIANHILLEDDFFPNLSGYPSPMMQVKMDQDYTLAISDGVDSTHRLILVDYPQQSMRTYDINIPNQIGSQHIIPHTDRVLYWVGWYGRTNIFHLELGSPVQEELLPAAKTTLVSFPNPFRSSCTVQVDAKSKAEASLEVYNLRGQLVKSLHKGMLNSGKHSFSWDGYDSHKQACSSGVYLLKLEQGGQIVSKRMILMK